MQIHTPYRGSGVSRVSLWIHIYNLYYPGFYTKHYSTDYWEAEGLAWWPDRMCQFLSIKTIQQPQLLERISIKIYDFIFNHNPQSKKKKNSITLYIKCY